MLQFLLLIYFHQEIAISSFCFNLKLIPGIGNIFLIDWVSEGLQKSKTYWFVRVLVETGPGRTEVAACNPRQKKTTIIIVLDDFWTSYVRSIYVLRPGGWYLSALSRMFFSLYLIQKLSMMLKYSFIDANKKKSSVFVFLKEFLKSI